jgi:hypothetical protein
LWEKQKNEAFLKSSGQPISSTGIVADEEEGFQAFHDRFLLRKTSKPLRKSKPNLDSNFKKFKQQFQSIM